MLSVVNGAFSYSPRSRLLFQNLSFQVDAGEVLAILGPNGVGKTTLLKCMMQFLSLNQGEIRIDDSPVSSMGSRAFWQKVSYVPQAKKLVFGYSALNMVVMGLSQNIAIGRTPSAADYERGMELLRQFGIEEIAEQSCNTLSGGQLQMVLIARALIKEPAILIMDEPESNLDMKNQLIVLDAIEKLSKDDHLTIVMNTHFPAHALRCADKTLLLGQTSYLFGDSGQIVTAEHIREYFEVDAELLETRRAERDYVTIAPIRILENGPL